MPCLVRVASPTKHGATAEIAGAIAGKPRRRPGGGGRPATSGFPPEPEREAAAP